MTLKEKLSKARAALEQLDAPRGRLELVKRCRDGQRWLTQHYDEYMDSEDPAIRERYTRAMDRLESLDATLRWVYHSFTGCVWGEAEACPDGDPMKCRHCAGGIPGRPFFNPLGQQIGVLLPVRDALFLKKEVRESVHKLHTPPGWATDAEHLEVLASARVRGIVLDDMETDRMYWSRLRDWQEKGREMIRGHGAQVFLVDKFWHEGSEPPVEWLVAE